MLFNVLYRTLVAHCPSPESILNLFKVFFCVIVGATQIGQAAPNLQDIANAKGAAHFIYDLMDSVSTIIQSI